VTVEQTEQMDSHIGRNTRELREAKQQLAHLEIRAREIADSHNTIADLLRESPEKASEMAQLDYQLRTNLPAELITRLGTDTAAVRARVRELESRQRSLLG